VYKFRVVLANPSADAFTKMDFKNFLLTNELRTLVNPLNDAVTLVTGKTTGQTVEKTYP